jgi:hypothetical protein
MVRFVLMVRCFSILWVSGCASAIGTSRFLQACFVYPARRRLRKIHKPTDWGASQSSLHSLCFRALTHYMLRYVHALVRGALALYGARRARIKWCVARTTYTVHIAHALCGAPRARIIGAPRSRFSGSLRARFIGAPRARFIGAPRARIIGAPRARIIGAPRARIIGAPCARIIGAPCARNIGAPCARIIGAPRHALLVRLAHAILVRLAHALLVRLAHALTGRSAHALLARL